MPLYPDTEYTFGRDRSCTVVFSDTTVSREHGLLYCADGVWIYRDRGSSNGSYLADHLEPEVRPPPESEADRERKALDAIEEVRPISPGHPCHVSAGQSVVLGNRAGRICFLAEAPAPEAADLAKRSEPSRELDADIKRAGQHRMPVFLLGPTGSGKTWAARRIHELSGVEGPFVLVDCGGLPSDVNSQRSELLGHVKGAFSDAREARLGKLSHADGGTVLLDEVESLSKEGQGLLLNLIDGTGDFAPLGQAANIEQKRPRFRLISASKRPLNESGLREDLCNRLGRGDIIVLPSLDDRRSDIPDMVKEMATLLNRELELRVTFEPAAIRLLKSISWPGNVRELEGVVRTAVGLECADDLPTGQWKKEGDRYIPIDRGHRPVFITAASLSRQMAKRQLAFGRAASSSVAENRSVQTNSVSLPPAHKRPRDYTRDELQAALDQHGHNQAHTAETLGIAVNTLKTLMKKLSIKRRST